MEDVGKELWKRNRRRRKEVGWSQEKLAFLTDINRSYVGDIERGDRNVFFTIVRLCAWRCGVMWRRCRITCRSAESEP